MSVEKPDILNKNFEIVNKSEPIINEKIWDKETKEDLEILRINALFNRLLKDDITFSNYESYKKDFKEVLVFLNGKDNILDLLEMPIKDLLNYISIIAYKITIVVTIKYLLEKLNPDYKWSNILEHTNNAPLDQEYVNYLEEEFNRINIEKWKDPEKELKSDDIKKEADVQEIINLVQKFYKNQSN